MLKNQKLCLQPQANKFSGSLSDPEFNLQRPIRTIADSYEKASPIIEMAPPRGLHGAFPYNFFTLQYILFLTLGFRSRFA